MTKLLECCSTPAILLVWPKGDMLSRYAVTSHTHNLQLLSLEYLTRALCIAWRLVERRIKIAI